MLARHVAIAGVIAVDEESSIGQADLFDDTPREHAALKAKLVHFAIAFGAEAPLCNRVGNAERQDELILPEERAAVEIQPRGLDHIEAVCPFGETIDSLGDDEHVVVHDPKPLSSKLVCPLGAGREATRAAAVLVLRGIDNAFGVSPGIRFSFIHAPQIGQPPVKGGTHRLSLARILVVDDHDAPWGGRELCDRVEKVCEEFLTLVRHHHDGQFIDGGGKAGSHEREYPFAWAAYRPCVINIVAQGGVTIVSAGGCLRIMSR